MWHHLYTQYFKLTKIIGISCYFHDSAACLIEDGKIISALQEERFTRNKHDPNFPTNSIKKIFKIHNISLKDLDAIVFYEKPFLKFERLLETYIKNSPKGFISFKTALPIWVKEKLYLKKMIINELHNNFNYKYDRIFFSQHHLSHAASAYYPSPFDEAAILIADGVGEWSTTSMWSAKNKELINLKNINFPHSIGLLYSSFTQYLGFKVNSGEYKMMGLAPFGKPIFKQKIYDELVNIYDDSSFELNLKYFNYETGLTMINNKFEELFKKKTRSTSDKIENFHANIASSIQEVTEEIYLNMLSHLKSISSSENLCLAGGVALNCVANGKIKNKTKFKNIWIQPASGDAGGCIGAALSYYYKYVSNERIVKHPDSMNGSYLGTSYDNIEIEEDLNKEDAIFEYIEDDNKLISITVDNLINKKAIGWFQGRMEFGPRALGNRSIIADPRDLNMQKKLNLKIKFRESFRPFAPSVLEEEVSNYFDYNDISPYMLMVAQVKKKHLFNVEYKYSDNLIDKINEKRSSIPSITHVDNSARLHTVSQNTNNKFFQLIKSFHEKTGVPILINTSFNIRGEPIVESPRDAYRCFMGTNLDILVCGNYLIYKNKQKKSLKVNYKDQFELD